MEKVSVLRTGYKQGRRTMVHESGQSPSPSPLLPLLPPPTSPLSSLFMEWLREKELEVWSKEAQLERHRDTYVWPEL